MGVMREVGGGRGCREEGRGAVATGFRGECLWNMFSNAWCAEGAEPHAAKPANINLAPRQQRGQPALCPPCPPPAQRSG